RDDRGRPRPLLLAERLGHGPPVDAREEQVDEDDVRMLGTGGLQPGRAIGRGERLVAGRADDALRDVEVVRVVLDDEHTCHRQDLAPSDACSTCAARMRTGSVKRNVLPTPTVLSTQMRPPCSPTRRFEMARPRPVPPYLRVVELSACRNSSKMYASASCGMPTPVSVTASVIQPSADAAAMVTLPCSVNFTAFAARFTRICRMRARSANAAGRPRGTSISSASPLPSACGRTSSMTS